jgi:hypothetical protein
LWVYGCYFWVQYFWVHLLGSCSWGGGGLSCDLVIDGGSDVLMGLILHGFLIMVIHYLQVSKVKVEKHKKGGLNCVFEN